MKGRRHVGNAGVFHASVVETMASASPLCPGTG